MDMLSPPQGKVDPKSGVEVLASGSFEAEKALHERVLKDTKTAQSIDRTVIAVGRALLLAIALLIWAYASGRWLDAKSVSDPWSVFSALFDLIATGRLWPQLWQTVLEVFAGYTLGATAGIGCALLFALFPNSERIFGPFLLALYSIPKIALAPLIVMWFGLGIAPKIILAAMFVFFIVFMNALAGIQSVNRHHVNILRVMGGTKLMLMTKIILPTMVPFLILGLRVSIPEAMTGAVIGEFIAASRGLGYLVYSAANEMNMAVSLAALVVLVFVVAMADFALGYVEKRLPWQSAGNRLSSHSIRTR